MEKFIQITSGRGPAECAWVVAKVLKQFLAEAEAAGLETEVIRHVPGSQNGTVESATVRVFGKAAEAFTGSWVGTIQWIGQSAFRKFHKRKNWFIGVFEIDVGKLSEVSEKDISYQTMRSSGAGGQHVNKVASAVRAVHLPTGESAMAQDNRSQHLNKKLARERLLKKLEAVGRAKILEAASMEWENQLAFERGNPKRIFTGSDFKNKPIVRDFKKERRRLKNDLRNENDQ